MLLLAQVFDATLEAPPMSLLTTETNDDDDMVTVTATVTVTVQAKTIIAIVYTHIIF